MFFAYMIYSEWVSDKRQRQKKVVHCILGGSRLTLLCVLNSMARKTIGVGSVLRRHQVLIG